MFCSSPIFNRRKPSIFLRPGSFIKICLFKFYFFFDLFLTKRQVVWLYGQTTGLSLPFVVSALGQTTCRLGPIILKILPSSPELFKNSIFTLRTSVPFSIKSFLPFFNHQFTPKLIFLFNFTQIHLIH